MATPSSTSDTVTVSVNTLSTALAAAIHQATGTTSTSRGRSHEAPPQTLGTVTDEASGSGITANSK